VLIVLSFVHLIYLICTVLPADARPGDRSYVSGMIVLNYTN